MAILYIYILALVAIGFDVYGFNLSGRTFKPEPVGVVEEPVYESNISIRTDFKQDKPCPIPPRWNGRDRILCAFPIPE